MKEIKRLFRKVHFIFWGGIFIFGFGVLVQAGAKGKKMGAVTSSCPVSVARESKAAPVTVYSLVENHSLVKWDTLANFDAPNPGDEEDMKVSEENKKYPVPGFIKALDGKKVAAIGFMVPSETDEDEKDEKAISFFLTRTQGSCCFGLVPRINEFIFVQMQKGKKAEIVMDTPITVFGTLSVGTADLSDTGRSLYRMVAEKTAAPKEPNW